MARGRRGVTAAVALAAILLGPASGLAQQRDEDIHSFEDRALDQVTSPGLETFESEAAFRTYLRRVEQIKSARSRQWIAGLPRSLRFAQAEEEPCIPGDPACPEDDGGQDVIVTGSVASPPASITNNQTTGVDEGDIVKQIGPFLLVLQDGRIFSIDTRGGLKLADRIDVYRDPESDTWYDEMLVQDDHVLINAYSYEEEATELSIFSIDRTTGKLTAQGVFLITSDDYYDVDNYATRIVGDRLVIYTPYEPETLVDRARRPVVRPWLPEAEREAAERKAGDRRLGRPLFGARDIYRPVQRTAAPVIHSLSICRLGAWKPGDELQCRVTAFVGPQEAEMFVSPEEIYLWTWPGWRELGWNGDCDDEEGGAGKRGRPRRADVIPSAIFRVPLDGNEPGVVSANGRPFDQFGMDSRDGEFRALGYWQNIRCESWENPDLAFLKLPWSSFGGEFMRAADRQFTPLPSPGKRVVENRFADQWLVYGGRNSWSGYPPDDNDPPQQSAVVTVPVERPANAKNFTLPHTIVRTERVGDDMVLNGYRDGTGLTITLLKLGATPHVGSSVTLPRRFESEGRSHAFNSITDRNGDGVIGVPTVLRPEESGRWWWRSDASDLSFLTLNRAGALRDVGALLTRAKGGEDKDPDEAEERALEAKGYSCEVSCIDWYGNSRPIFTDGRIFGLMGTELVEARIAAGRIEEVRRLDLTQRVPGR